MNRKSKHARLLELGKDVLIVLLACSAVWLTTRVQRTGSLGDLLADTPQEGQGQTQAPGQMEMVRPVRMAAVGRSGETTIRYGAQYDQQSTDALFQQVANLLVEALSDGGEMSPVSQWEWRTALTSPPSLYFDLMEGVPLSVLTGWLTGESTGGEVFVRRLALAASRGQVFLYYQDEESGQFYAGPVDVISVSRLESAVSGLSDKGGVQPPVSLHPADAGHTPAGGLSGLQPPQPGGGPQQPAGGTGLPGQQQLHLSGDRRRVGGAQRV